MVCGSRRLSEGNVLPSEVQSIMELFLELKCDASEPERLLRSFVVSCTFEAAWLTSRSTLGFPLVIMSPIGLVVGLVNRLGTPSRLSF